MPALAMTLAPGVPGEMDEASIRRRLDACLVGDADAKAMPVTAWKRLPDPFPVWKRKEA